MPIKSNDEIAFNGHTQFPTSGGEDPSVTKVAAKIIPKGEDDNKADIADSLANIIGKGYTSLSDEDARAEFVALKGILGTEKATALIQQALIFNQRDDIKKKGVGDKLRSFYETGSKNKDVDEILGGLKTFSGGANAWVNKSSNVGSQNMTGRNQGGKGDITALQLNTLKTYAPKD